MDAFGRRVQAAAAAGWWAVLIGAVWIFAGWFLVMWVLTAKPGWILAMWGGIITWKDAREFTMWFFMTFKIILFVLLLLTVWLTIWAKKLKKAD